jgi:hypothetical protein
VVDTVYALLTYILGFVALEVPRAGTDPQTSDEFVRRMWAFFAALPPGEFPTPSNWPRSWPAAPPTTSSSSASGPSWPASKPKQAEREHPNRDRRLPCRLAAYAVRQRLYGSWIGWWSGLGGGHQRASGHAVQ